MVWLKQKKDAHDCDIPYLEPSDIGDIWMCDECKRVWEQVPYMQYRDDAIDLYTTFPSGNKQFGRIKEYKPRMDAREAPIPDWAEWAGK